MTTPFQQAAQAAAKLIRELGEPFDHWRLCPSEEEMEAAILKHFAPLEAQLFNEILRKLPMELVAGSPPPQWNATSLGYIVGENYKRLEAQLVEWKTTAETLAKHHKGLTDSRNDHAKNFRQSEVKRIEVERERDEARREVETLQIRHAAAMLHTQTVVDENTQLTSDNQRLREAVKLLGANCTCLVMGDKETDGGKHSTYCKVRIQHDALSTPPPSAVQAT